MAFPTGTQIPTTNVDSPDDDPSLARVDIYDLITAVNQLIASANTASGVCVLNASGKITPSQLPSSYTTESGQLQLFPANAIVNIRNVLRLTQINADDLGSALGTTSPNAGDLAYLTNGDAGQPCLACYDGANWRIVRFATQVGSAGAALTATSTFTATADL